MLGLLAMELTHLSVMKVRQSHPILLLSIRGAHTFSIICAW